MCQQILAAALSLIQTATGKGCVKTHEPENRAADSSYYVYESRLKQIITLEKINEATLHAIEKSCEEFSHSLGTKRTSGSLCDA